MSSCLAIGLDAIQPDAANVGKLLAAVRRTLRKQHKLSDDSGYLIPDAVAAECLASALALQRHRPGLMPG